MPRYIRPYRDGLRVGTISLADPMHDKTMDIDGIEEARPRVRNLIDDQCAVQITNETIDLNGDGRDDILSICYGAGPRPGRVSLYLINQQAKRSRPLSPRASIAK